MQLSNAGRQAVADLIAFSTERRRAARQLAEQVKQGKGRTAKARKLAERILREAS